MKPVDSIQDSDVARFIDGELTDTQRADVQARLAGNPGLAAEVFAESHRMEAMRAIQPRRLFPPRESVARAEQLERAFRRRKYIAAIRLQLAAALLIGIGWAANSLTEPMRRGGNSVDENFILEAREALRVAQLNSGIEHSTEPEEDKIDRLVGALNINMPQLPPAWKVVDVQVQQWNGKQSLVVTANTATVGQVTLIAVPMSGEDAVPPTLAADGRVPTVYWQSGGTAYALMGPGAPERLKNEAKGIEVATRRNIGPKIRS
jgi:anti-sigma factor RsiW